MNYAVEQRMRFIDFLAYKYGFINRSMLMDYYGIGEACATRDFAKYKELAPDNLVYNLSERAYYKTQQFESIYE